MAFVFLTVNMFAAQSWKNETLKYALYIGPIKAGEASFVTKNTTFEGQKVVRMDLIARTTSAAEKIFSMNDTLTTYLDADNVRPVYFRKSCNEGGDIYTEYARFTYSQDGTCNAKMRKNYMDGRVKDKRRGRCRQGWLPGNQPCKQVGTSGLPPDFQAGEAECSISYQWSVI